MENVTDICNTTFAALSSALVNSTFLCDNRTEATTLPTPLETDDAYWQRVLPKFRQLYIEDIYGEYYKLVFNVSLVVCIVGYVTNIFNVVVLFLTPMAHSMNLFLLVLSIADIFHISTQFSHIVHYLSGFRLFPGYQWVVFYMWNTYFETLFLFMTNWLAVAIGAWRFIAITWPLHTREWCSKRRGKIVVVVIFILSAILASPIFAIITGNVVTYRGRDLYDKVFTEFASEHNRIFLKTYWVIMLFMGFVPSLLLAILTFGLFRNLYLARKKRRSISDTRKVTTVLGSHKTTVMLSILLTLYILSNFPDGCMYLVSILTNGDEGVQNETRHFTDVFRIFMLSNNSASFFIYYGLGEGFRTRFHKAFCCCIVRRISRDESAKTTISELNRSRTNISSELYNTSVLEKPVERRVSIV